MKHIKLTNMDMSAMVDDEDYERLNKHKWRMNKRGYACTSVWLKGTGKGTIWLMHRLVLDVPKGMDCDHKDQNKINNQRQNLRVVNRSENMQNVQYIKKETSHSKYKGVSRLNRPKLKKQWLAYIKVDYKTYYLGYHDTQEEAAHVYNQAAEQIFGEHASLNQID